MIIADTDFLSSFLKINRLELVRDFFNEPIYIPLAVQKEIAKTNLIKKLNEKEYVKIVNVKRKISDYEKLGEGEIECLSLAKENDLVLMNDKQAGKVLKKEGIKVVNILDFLLAIKEYSFVNKKTLKIILEDLKQKDYYIFSKEEEKLLN